MPTEPVTPPNSHQDCPLERVYRHQLVTALDRHHLITKWALEDAERELLAAFEAQDQTAAAKITNGLRRLREVQAQLQNDVVYFRVGASQDDKLFLALRQSETDIAVNLQR